MQLSVAKRSLRAASIRPWRRTAILLNLGIDYGELPIPQRWRGFRSIS